jgi:hypothetical protein
VLPTIEKLDLSFNELLGDSLPLLALNAPRLRKLDLSHNCISSIPLELHLFTRLTDLNLTANDLVQFGQWSALEHLPSLKRLVLAQRLMVLETPCACTEPFTILATDATWTCKAFLPIIVGIKLTAVNDWRKSLVATPN